jgi:hypothetical protein
MATRADGPTGRETIAVDTQVRTTAKAGRRVRIRAVSARSPASVSPAPNAATDLRATGRCWTTACRTLGRMIAPFVLVEEGHDVQFFPSLDALVSQVEAQDVRDGIYEAFDGDGRAIELTAASDLSLVMAKARAHAADRLKSVLVDYIAAVGPDRVGVAEQDLATVDLVWLLRSIQVFHAGGRPPVW